MRASVLGLCAAAVSAAKLPNILHILVDDFGWADAGWHRPDGYTDVQTPIMNSLVKEGVELDRHYVYKFCSPTRSAVQSGRNPIYVNVLNLDPSYTNASDPIGGYAAVPPKMTGMAEHMLRAGYETHMYGKWDAGMATPEQSPHGRGYQHSLHYFHHANDYWRQTVGKCNNTGEDGTNAGTTQIVDLWDTTKPAHGQNNTPTCSQKNQHEGCVYEDQLFTDRVMAAIDGRDQEKPFFIFWAPHIVHTPLQVPDAYLERFAFIDDEKRQFYHAMVNFVDEAIGNVTQKLKYEGLWDNTLVVVFADNGGPIYNAGSAGANNYPLKGGKMANWEGGIRVNAFATGGLLPAAVRGTKQEGLMTGWDWYATYAALAGVDPTDKKAASAGLPPIDSHNLWPLLSGSNSTSPRAELAIGSYTGDIQKLAPDPLQMTKVGGLINQGYKLLVGTNEQAGWPGPKFPNSTSTWNPTLDVEVCGNTMATGCLFDIMQDPGEHVNLASKKPEIFKRMMARIAEIEKGVFSPYRGSENPAACDFAMNKYGGFWGPFIDVDVSSDSQLVV